MTEQSKMPARIWAHPSASTVWCLISFTTPSADYNVAYIRADLVEQMAEALRLAIRRASIPATALAVKLAGWIDSGDLAIIHCHPEGLGALDASQEQRDLIATALRRLASSEDGVKVRELEWSQSPPPAHEHEPFVYWAAGLGGHYRAERDGLLWMAHDAFVWEQHPTQNAAKAAAQRDYEVRILSALDM